MHTQTHTRTHTHANTHTQVDVYSFAMICYQLFECVPPFWWQDPIEAARGAAMQHKRPTWGAVNRAKVVLSVSYFFGFVWTGVMECICRYVSERVCVMREGGHAAQEAHLGRREPCKSGGECVMCYCFFVEGVCSCS